MSPFTELTAGQVEAAPLRPPRRPHGRPHDRDKLHHIDFQGEFFSVTTSACATRTYR